MPHHVFEALEIDDLINADVHLRNLDDSELVDEGDDEPDEVIEVEDSDTEVVDNKSKKKSGPVLKAFRSDALSSTSSRPSITSRRAQAEQFMTAVSASLDPAAREARDEARFMRRAMQEEAARLHQENRDLRARIEALTDRVTQHASENVRLQSRLETMELMRAEHMHRPSYPLSTPPSHFYPSHFSPAQRFGMSPYSYTHSHSYSPPRSPSQPYSHSYPTHSPSRLSLSPPRWEAPPSPPSRDRVTPPPMCHGLGYRENGAAAAGPSRVGAGGSTVQLTSVTVTITPSRRA